MNGLHKSSLEDAKAQFDTLKFSEADVEVHEYTQNAKENLTDLEVVSQGTNESKKRREFKLNSSDAPTLKHFLIPTLSASDQAFPDRGYDPQKHKKLQSSPNFKLSTLECEKVVDNVNNDSRKPESLSMFQSRQTIPVTSTKFNSHAELQKPEDDSPVSITKSATTQRPSSRLKSFFQMVTGKLTGKGQQSKTKEDSDPSSSTFSSLNEKYRKIRDLIEDPTDSKVKSTVSTSHRASYVSKKSIEPLSGVPSPSKLKQRLMSISSNKESKNTRFFTLGVVTLASFTSQLTYLPQLESYA